MDVRTLDSYNPWWIDGRIPARFRGMVHILSQPGHPFQSNPATHSEAKRPPIPTRRRPLFGPSSE